MIVNSNGKYFFGLVLPDNVFIQKALDLGGFLNREFEAVIILLFFYGQFLIDDLTGMLYTVFADMTVLSGNQDLDLVAAATTKRAVKRILSHCAKLKKPLRKERLIF